MKTIHNERYSVLIGALVKARKDSGFTQQQVAEKLGKPQSYIAKIEKLERKLDVLEFVDLCAVIGADRGEVLELVEVLKV